MPDKFNFDHLPWWGAIEVRCIDCSEGGSAGDWSEKQRQRHFEKHIRDAQKERERNAKAVLKEARRLKAQAEKENGIAYGKEAA